MELTLTQADSDIQVMYNGDYFVLDFLYDPKIFSKLHEIPGADNGNIEERKWVIPKENLKDLNRLLNQYIIWKSPEEMANEKRDLEIVEESLDDVLTRIPKDIQTPYMKLDPYDFQKLSVGWAITPKGSKAQIHGGLLADLMGLGKTIQALAISGKFKELGKVQRVLIICPATLKFQWSQEIEKFTHEKSLIIEGDKKKREKQFQKIKDDNPFYTLINYELLRQKDILGREPVGKPKNGEKQKTKAIHGDYNVLASLLDIGYDMVIIDEAHRMKNPDSETAKVIRQINPEYKLLMTGTPITKDLQNIFQLLDYLSPNILSSSELDFEQRRKQFEDKFVVTAWNPFTKWNKEKMVVGVKNVGVLKNLVAPYMLRRTTEEVSDDMPTQKEFMITVGWDKDQKSLYEQLAKELVDLQEIKGHEKDPIKLEKIDNEMHALYLYMLETCNTPELLLMSDSALAKKKIGNRKSFSKPPKLNRVIEMAEEIMANGEDKIIIFTKFERMTQILRRELLELSKDMAKKNGSKNKLDFGLVMYTGETKKGCKWMRELDKNNESSSGLKCTECPFFKECDTREKSAWLFQNHPGVRIILATDAANYGVNLQSGKYLFNYDLPDSFSVYDQRKGRNKRLGSKYKEVYVYNFGIDGAIDHSKFNKLMKQKEIIDMVVEKNELEEDAVIRVTQEINMMNDIIKEMKTKK